MCDSLIFTLLVGGVKLLASGVFEKPTAVGLGEVIGRDLPIIDQRYHNRIRDNRTKFLHQIQREAGTPISLLMEEANVGIKPNNLDCGDDICGQQRVGKTE